MHTAPRRSVLVVEDHGFVRTLVANSLENDGFRVRAVETADEAIACFAEFDPDLLLTDIDLGSRPNGIDLATILRAQVPHLPVVFLTNYPSASHAPRATRLPAGSRLVNKSGLDSFEELRTAIDAALRDRLDADAGAPATSTVLAGLTSAQLEVLRLIAEGWSNNEIAGRQSTSVRAVEKIITRIFDALHLRDDSARNARVRAAMAYARQFGLPPGAAP